MFNLTGMKIIRTFGREFEHKFIISLIIFCSCCFVYGQNDLSLKDIAVLKEPADTMMKSYLLNIVDRQFAVRDSLLSTLKSAKDWDKRAQTIRDSMISWTGPFPERTPLNVRITGRLDREDYVIEKILFESRPDYLVSANLYIPKNLSFPRPAILNVIGHSPEGKAADKVQMRSISQAKKGFVALTFDCMGQGERQIGDPSTWTRSPGYAHQIIGTQAFISGTNVFNLMVWDAIRAIDYLVSRPEVDADNISITGCSGGGMMTTYILPFETRLKVAVPACNPNTWSYRAHAGLSADHEQIFFGCFESAIDPRGDPLFTTVPKPLLIDATTDDNLNPPRGVWDLSNWLFKSYSAHGVPEKFSTTMVKAGHGYNKEQREIAYSWLLRWTGGDSSDFPEEDIPIEKDEELWAASGGNVFNESESRRPEELVLDYLKANAAKAVSVMNSTELKQHQTRMSQLTEEVLHTKLNKIEVEGSIEKSVLLGNIRLSKIILKPEKGIILPAILLEPATKFSNPDIILYISQKGKSDILNDMGIINEILRKGYRVFAVDLRGMGETAPDMAGVYWDFLSGKPIFGQRVRDVLAAIKWLGESEIKAQNIKLWGKGMCALYGAFAGVVCKNITGLVLEEPLLSFESVVHAKVPVYRNEIMLPGVLEKFDMTRIYQALCPRPLSVINPLLGDGTRAGLPDIETIDKPLLTTYRSIRKHRNWSIGKLNNEERDKTIIYFITNN